MKNKINEKEVLKDFIKGKTAFNIAVEKGAYKTDIQKIKANFFNRK